MPAQRRRSIPYYQQVANVLRARIIGLADQPPVRLPDERELSRTHNVARATVRRALEALQSEGLIERAPGRGTLTVPAGIRVWRKLRGSRMISLVTSWRNLADDPAGYYGQIYQGILVSAEEAGYSLITRNMSGPFPPIGPQYSPEDPKQVIGVIVVTVMDDRVIAMHADAGYPVVCVDYWPGNPKVDAVVVDCFGEAQMAVQFLLDQGHRDLFYLGNISGRGDHRQREADAELMMAGCRRALEQAGLSLPASRVRFCRREAGEVARAVKWFVSLRNRPTAGVIFDAEALQHFVAGLPEHGLSCPADVSLICKTYAGNPLAAATVRGDGFRMGQLAVELLIERASDRRQIPQIVAIRSQLERGATVRGVHV